MNELNEWVSVKEKSIVFPDGLNGKSVKKNKKYDGVSEWLL